MNKENLLELIKQRKSEHERLGQAVFNFCLYLFPEKTELCRATSLDPFHNDKAIDAFLDVVMKEEK